MPFVPVLLQEYRDCEQLLKTAEKVGSETNDIMLSWFERVFSDDFDAMVMMRRHTDYGPRVSGVLEKIRKMRAERERLAAEAKMQCDMAIQISQSHERKAPELAYAGTRTPQSEKQEPIFWKIFSTPVDAGISSYIFARHETKLSYKKELEKKLLYSKGLEEKIKY